MIAALKLNKSYLPLVRFYSLNPEYAIKREEFWRQEKLRESKVDLEKFSKEEKEIYLAHKDAINKHHFSYDDPITHDKIWTTYHIFLKKRCCGEGCRHCIYDFENVSDEIRNQKKFNGMFWVDLPRLGRSRNFFQKLFKLIKTKPKMLKP